jgi:hypothetical protein
MKRQKQKLFKTAPEYCPPDPRKNKPDPDEFRRIAAPIINKHGLDAVDVLFAYASHHPAETIPCIAEDGETMVIGYNAYYNINLPARHGVFGVRSHPGYFDSIQSMVETSCEAIRNPTTRPLGESTAGMDMYKLIQNVRIGLSEGWPIADIEKEIDENMNEHYADWRDWAEWLDDR